jgi:hypothetical protein
MIEAKASTRQEPRTLIEKNVSQFLIDIKTRAVGFAYRYDAYLIAVLFQDGRRIECTCLHINLTRYSGAGDRSGMPHVGPEARGTEQSGGFDTTVPSHEDPRARLRSIIQLCAEIANVRDEYLTSLLSEEATRTATVEMLRNGEEPTPTTVDEHIKSIASEMGLGEAWARGQEVVGDLKDKEDDEVSKALERYHKPTLELE